MTLSKRASYVWADAPKLRIDRPAQSGSPSAETAGPSSWIMINAADAGISPGADGSTCRNLASNHSNADSPSSTTTITPGDGHLKPRRNKANAENDDTSETDSLSSSTTITLWDGDLKLRLKDAVSQNDRQFLWLISKKLITVLLAYFVIARGVNPDAAAASLAPTATMTNSKKKDTLEDISNRFLSLQRKILGGNTGKEEEEELAKLIASAIFSRETGADTMAVVEIKEIAICARKTADKTCMFEALQRAELLEDSATTAAKLWLLNLFSEGKREMKSDSYPPKVNY